MFIDLKVFREFMAAFVGIGFGVIFLSSVPTSTHIIVDCIMILIGSLCLGIGVNSLIELVKIILSEKG